MTTATYETNKFNSINQKVTLKQYLSTENEIIAYYDRVCSDGIGCIECERNIDVEKRIVSAHGIKDFSAFEELLLRNYFD